MKTQNFFALVGIFSAFIVFQPTVAARQEHQNLAETPNFVVIGAFAIPNNAKRFTEQANKRNLHAQFMINPNRNLYYVYVLSTIDRDKAIGEALRLRQQPEFSDAWVYNGMLGNMQSIGEPQMQSRGIDINPATEQKIENVLGDDSTHGTSSVLESTMPVVIPSAQKTESSEVEQIVDAVATEQTSNQDSELDRGVEGANFYFKIFRTSDNKSVDGDVDVIDVDRTRKIGTYKGNMGVKVSDPASKSDNISLMCEVFGYRKVQHDINYITPEGEDITKNESGAVQVPFELVRLQKGDIAVMYNVYFFKDAAIMRPESHFEVNSLLEMLKENPNYKIKIHGH
ncbi:MAG TPA: hypothetical protein PKU83_08970, partial [Chryseolinea sp.]|nr:hypothetical protein [Chryseolinea sp.]